MTGKKRITDVRKVADGSVVLVDRYHMSYEGRVAYALMPTVGMVAITLGIEPAKIATIACDLASAFLDELDRRGWSYEVDWDAPAPSDAHQKMDPGRMQ